MQEIKSHKALDFMVSAFCNSPLTQRRKEEVENIIIKEGNYQNFAFCILQRQKEKGKRGNLNYQPRENIIKIPHFAFRKGGR